jgi:hypothetical protein
MRVLRRDAWDVGRDDGAQDLSSIIRIVAVKDIQNFFIQKSRRERFIGHRC